MRSFLEYMITDFRFTPHSSWGSIALCVMLNGAIRFGTLYLVVRAFLTAVNHGAF